MRRVFSGVVGLSLFLALGAAPVGAQPKLAPKPTAKLKLAGKLTTAQVTVVRVGLARKLPRTPTVAQLKLLQLTASHFANRRKADALAAYGKFLATTKQKPLSSVEHGDVQRWVARQAVLVKAPALDGAAYELGMAELLSRVYALRKVALLEAYKSAPAEGETEVDWAVLQSVHVDSSKNKKLDRNGMGNTITETESQSEKAKSRRDQAAEAFSAYDEKVKQVSAMLADILRSMQGMAKNSSVDDRFP
ncbi:MAG: hypothetical protein KC776_28950 [Myxococcales bacterium]|nr:hypothetical protein [Myxococcales bacterium]MCB9580945.1 hypothetical protein [Polyangiaceae bacterium]